MKKLFFIAIAAMGMTLASCGGSVESKAKAFVKDMYEAQKAGDVEKIAKIAQEAEEWNSSLSKEDQEKAEAAAQEVLQELIKGE